MCNKVFILISILASICVSQPSLLTGQITKNISLFQIKSYGGVSVPVNLHYSSSGINKNRLFPNGSGADSWIGFGWYLGWYSIYVDHKYTVDRSDDTWYLVTPDLESIEIMRSFNNGKEEFHLRDNPYWKVEAFYDGDATSSMSIITGWELIDPSGTRYFYGSSSNSRRSVRCKHNTIQKKSTWLGGSNAGFFNYQWDISSLQDVNGGWVKFYYQQIIEHTNNIANKDQWYVKQSYLRSIENDFGEVAKFTLDPEKISVIEMRPSHVSLGTHLEFAKEYYLQKIEYTNIQGDLIVQYRFDYLNTTEYVNAFTKGFSKRLLEKITSSTSEANNYLFSYYDDKDYAGYLRTVSYPTGKIEKFEYTKQEIPQDLKVIKSAITKTPALQSNTTIIDTLQHIFIMDETKRNSNWGTNLEILDMKYGRADKWTYADKLPGITYENNESFFIPHTRCYPFGDRLVLLTIKETRQKIGSVTIKMYQHNLNVYEYINDTWAHTFSRDFDDYQGWPMEVHQAGNYFALFESNALVIYIFNKTNNKWTSTFNSPKGNTNFKGIRDDCGHDDKGEGWNWPVADLPTGHKQKSQLFVSEDYFLFTYRRTFKNESYPRVCAQIFKWTGGTSWEHVEYPEGKTPDGTQKTYLEVNGYKYKFSDILMKVNTNAATEYQEKAGLQDGYFYVYSNAEDGRSNIAVRQYDTFNKYWESVRLGPFGLDKTPQGFYRWPRRVNLYASNTYLLLLEPYNDSWCQIFRMNFDEKALNLSVITALPGASSSSVYDDKHKVGGRRVRYTKAFRRSDIQEIKTMEDGFFVSAGSGIGSATVLWYYMYNSKKRAWESAINGYDLDRHGQFIGNDIENFRLLNCAQHYGLVAQEKEDNVSVNKAYIWSPDYVSGRYVKTDMGINSFASALSDDHFVTYNKDNSLTISHYYLNKWEGKVDAVISNYYRIHSGVAQGYRISYEYGGNEQYFDYSSGVPFFSQSEEWIATGEVGKNVQNFSLDSDQGIFGNIVKTVSLDKDGIEVTSTNYTWERIKKSVGQYDTSYHVYLKKQDTKSDGVKSSETYCISNYNKNGIPDWAYSKNSDGRSVVTQTVFCYEHPKYNGMKERNMLTQVCETRTYGYSANENWECRKIANFNNVVSAQTTAWKMFFANGKTYWRPYSNYVWNSPMTKDGKSQNSFVNFDHYAPESELNEKNHWQFAGKTEKFDAYGNELEEIDAKGLVTSNIYGMHFKTITGRVENARFDECGILNGDYDLKDQITYTSSFKVPSFDAVNGWEKGGGILSDEEKLFGNNSVKVVDGFGPTRNFKVYPGMDYIFSAWVKVKASTSAGQRLVMSGSYRKLSENASGEFPYHLGPWQKGFGVSQVVVDAPSSQEHERWQYIEMRIPASTDVSGNDWYTRVWVGTPVLNGEGGGSAYICDIRYYPADAIPITSYHERKFKLPITSVDGNNTPGYKVEYDPYARPVSIHKFIFDDNRKFQKMKLIKSNEYHFAKKDMIKPNPDNFSPGIPRRLTPSGFNQINGKDVIFSWASVTDQENDRVKYSIYLRSIEKEEGENILTGSNQTTFTKKDMDYGVYEWFVVADDGKETTISEPAYFFLVAGGFPIFDIAGRVVTRMPNDLFNSIKSSLSSTATRAMFEETYPNIDGKDRLYVECGCCPSPIIGETFRYKGQWPQSYKDCLESKCDEEKCECECLKYGKPHYNFPEGSVISTTEGSRIPKVHFISPPKDGNYFYPDIKVEVNFLRPVYGTFWKSGGWDQEVMARDGNKIKKLKWSTPTPNYHTWYRVQDSKDKEWNWKSNGVATDGNSHVIGYQFYLFNYDKDAVHYKLSLTSNLPQGASDPELSGTGSYKFTQWVNISAKTYVIEPGVGYYTFSHWEAPEGVTIVDPNSEQTTVQMPSKNIVIKAIYKRSPPPGWG